MEEHFGIRANSQAASELRRDPVTNDWIVIATGRAKRPDQFVVQKKADGIYTKKAGCPFENPQASGNPEPLLVLDASGNEVKSTETSWFVQVIPNKYPAFSGDMSDAPPKAIGPYSVLPAGGAHEVVVMRDHERVPGSFTKEEMRAVLSAYMLRFNELSIRPNIRYVSIFHNYGKEAGASLYHPHSQIMAIPVLPQDIARSLFGSRHYFEDHGKCVHCEMIAWEKEEGSRIIFENGYFIAFCPFVSRGAFEIRIFPKSHEPSFKEMGEDEIDECAEALRTALKKLNDALGNPPYNFFIHTSPIDLGADEKQYYPHYHWHIEILPKTAIWAGFELGTGIEISTIEPEKAAEFLRSF